jgi:hypothetical protein
VGSLLKEQVLRPVDGDIADDFGMPNGSNGEVAEA